MTELLIEKFYQARELTGLRGIVFSVILLLFILSFISDVVYQTATTASAAIKFVLLIGLGVSFGTLAQDITLPTFTKPSFKKKKRVKTRIIRETAVPVTAPAVVSKLTESKSILPEIRADLQEKKNQERAVKQREFFATKADQASKRTKDYLGVNISDIVKISEHYGSEVSLDEIKELLTSDVHDERIVAIWLLINSYKQSTIEQKQEKYIFYLENRELVDNWDMVDLAARNVIGAHIAEFITQKNISDTLISSKSVWDKRTAVMSAHPLLMKGDLGHVFSVVERLISCKEELVQSALGWVLKESYKKDPVATENFIKSHFESLSNQAIRIGTERMEKTYRKSFMRGEFETIQA